MVMTIQVRDQPNVVQRQMITNTEYERTRELLRARLTDCGWRDQVKKLCKRIASEGDIDELSADDIVDRVTPQARALVPDTVKKELLQKIKKYLMEDAGLTSSATDKMLHMR